MSGPNTVVLMGSQRLVPRVREVASALGLSGPFAVITAGWQEREDEDEELRAHLGEPVVNLGIKARAEAALGRDPDLSAAHRARQEFLRHLQDVYRIRLRHAFAAELDVRTYAAPAELRAEIDELSIARIRALDDAHLAQCRQLRREFEDAWRPLERDSVRVELDELREAIAPCKTVCIAGGHVAVLKNRMDLLGGSELLGDRPVIAWAAGAMVATERVVLFHDDAPQGELFREVLDDGLGLAKDVVVFPEPERRLALDNQPRALHLVQRFAPARCVVLPASSYVVLRNGQQAKAEGARTLTTEEFQS